MTRASKANILTLIRRLERDISFASRHSLDDTAKLLKIALLDARMRAYAISDRELKVLSNRLIHATPPPRRGRSRDA